MKGQLFRLALPHKCMRFITLKYTFNVVDFSLFAIQSTILC
uniref:Uncharacterized protein n=1 Tax=Arundo donax TaxID=35708 RepID=A0A0A9GHW8_ARUDO